jgi:hypothetical protein
MNQIAEIARFPKYEFHAAGFVVSMQKRNAIQMKPIKMGAYSGLQLKRADGVIEKIYLHRAICEAFHGPCPDGQVCRHLDGNRKNNAAENLAWGTPKQNNADKIAHGTTTAGERNPMSKLNHSDVLEMRRLRNGSGASFAAIASDFGVSTMTAHRAITGKSWRTA